MKYTTQAVWLGLAMSIAFAPRAEAQMVWTDQGFVNVNIGAQAGSRSLATERTFELYRETARVETAQDVSGGAIFDIAGGYKVWRNLAVGIAWSRVGSDSAITITGSIPDPLIFDSPRSIAASTTGAGHTEHAIHLQATWMLPVTDKIDVGFSFGPTIFSVSQDVVTAVSVSEPGPTVSSTTMAELTKTTGGFHLGLDVTYLVTPRYGAGLFARYTRGSVDFEGATDSLTVGGFQIGAGGRVRF